MKRYILIITALALFPAIGFAQEKQNEKTTVRIAPTQQSQEVVVKNDPLSVRKQRVEAELGSTLERLEVVAQRTEVAIELLKKNGRDTTKAEELMETAKKNLEEASIALSSFGNPQQEEISPLTTNKPLPEKAQALTALSLRDQVKGIQEKLKTARESLIESIKALRETVDQKNNQ